MIRKIGILTFNRPLNYGALLQAVALKEKVAFFKEAEIINYVCPYIENLYRPFNGGIFKGFVRQIFFGRRNKKFKKFIKEISTKRLYNKENIERIDYEKIIVGSDQVWNYSCSGNDEVFLLPNIEVKKYSYAASFGVNELPNEQTAFFKEKLLDFRYIAVREKTGQDICKNQLGLSAEVVLDPTLLLNQNDWDERLNIKHYKKAYILVYTLGPNKKVKEAAQKISKQLRIPIYNISTSAKVLFEKNLITTAGPREWVELFYNASFIVTDSFHGTAFSINFNKPFYSFASNSRASRIVDLLDTLGLQSRLNPTLEGVDPKTEIDYVSVNEKLEVERKKSIAFIEKIIND